MFSNRQIAMIDNASQLTGRYGRQSGFQPSQTPNTKSFQSLQQIPKSDISDLKQPSAKSHIQIFRVLTEARTGNTFK
jgi:hypothetical protein